MVELGECVPGAHRPIDGDLHRDRHSRNLECHVDRPGFARFDHELDLAARESLGADREQILARRDGKKDETAFRVGDALQDRASRRHRQGDSGASDQGRVRCCAHLPANGGLALRPRRRGQDERKRQCGDYCLAAYHSVAGHAAVLIVPIASLAATMRPVIGMDSGASENSPLLIAAGVNATSEPPQVKLVTMLFSTVRRMSMSEWSGRTCALMGGCASAYPTHVPLKLNDCGGA